MRACAREFAPLRNCPPIIPVLLAAVASSAQAAPAPVPDVGVTYGDLALNTRSGGHALAERIEAAADTHCRDYGEAITPHRLRHDPRFCRSAVKAALVRALPDDARGAYRSAMR